MQLKAILCRTSTKKQLRNACYKITPNLLFEYQCTSGKFIRLPNRIESKLFCPNWNALVQDTRIRSLAVNNWYALGRMVTLWPCVTINHVCDRQRDDRSMSLFQMTTHISFAYWTARRFRLHDHWPWWQINITRCNNVIFFLANRYQPISLDIMSWESPASAAIAFPCTAMCGVLSSFTYASLTNQTTC